MSFGLYQQITRSTVIDNCLVSSFTAADALNVILAKGDCFEIYEVRRGQLIYAVSVPLFGRPEAVGVFRPAVGGPDHFAIVFQRQRYLSVLRYEPDLGHVQTCGQHILMSQEDTAVGRGASSRPEIAVDPGHRCLVVRTLPDRVSVFPIAPDGAWQDDSASAAGHGFGQTFQPDPSHPPGLRAPFTLHVRRALRLQELSEIQFLGGYHQPTAACRGQLKPGPAGLRGGGGAGSRSAPPGEQEKERCPEDEGGSHGEGNSAIVIATIDLMEKAAHIIWSTRDVTSDVFRLVPLMDPVGGLLALSDNAVIYMKEHGPAFCQTLNPAAELTGELAKLPMPVREEEKLGLLLSGCSVVVVSPTVLLFAVQPSGRLYLAHLVLESKDVVSDIVWTSPGTVGATSQLHLVGESLALVASSAGASLLKLQPARKKLPQQQPPPKRARTSKDDDISDGLRELLAAYDGLWDWQRQIRSFNVSVVDEMAGLGAIHCLAPWCKDRGEEEDDAEEPLCGTMRFVCGSGVGARGSLYVLQRAVPLDVITDFDLPPHISAVWSFPQPPEQPLIEEAGGDGAPAPAPPAVEREGCQHRVLLLAGRSGSMVLEASEKIEEVSKDTVLDMSSPTIGAGILLRGQLGVQLTPHQMRFMWTANPTDSDVPAPVSLESGNESAIACSGRVCDPYILVALDDESIRLFEIQANTEVRDITQQLPAGTSRPAARASLFQSTASGASFLVVVSRAAEGTLTIIDLRSMSVVFRTSHLASAPPVLRGGQGEELDHLRSYTDPCALIQGDGKQGGRSISDELVLEQLRVVGDLCAPSRLLPPPTPGPQAQKPQQQAVAAAPQRAQQQAAAGGSAAAGESGGVGAAPSSPDPGIVTPTIIATELVEVDAQDAGPTLVVLVTGRPALIFRAFVPTGAPEGKAGSFPYHFTLCEHEHLEPISLTPIGPYQPVVPIRHGAGGASGVVVLPPHAGVPALWLAAKRNRLFIHPLPGTDMRGFAPLNAPCCNKGFIALAQGEPGSTSSAAGISVQICKLGGVEGVRAAFDLQNPMPCAQHVLGRTPHQVATRPQEGCVAVAVSEAVVEQPDQAAGPSIEEDPLSEDWSIIREPPVQAEPPPMPRLQPRFELCITSSRNLSKLSQYRFSFDADEQVLSMAWVDITGFPSPALAVGTGVNTGEDLTCRGRLLLFSTKDRPDGILPAVYQRSLKWPVTVVGQWGGYLLHSEGFKLFFERWEGTSFNKLAFYDGNMCLSSMSSIKNFLLLGDMRKGVEFVQWKEGADGQTRNLRRLSRSTPQVMTSVLASEFVVCGSSLGMVALDHVGTIHLYQYSPHSDGREGDQVLLGCAAFSTGSPCRAVQRVQLEHGLQCLIMGSGSGDFRCLRPMDDQAFRTLSALIGILATRLPYRGGLNPRACRHHDSAPSQGAAPRKNIEDAVLLRQFFFLSTPLQASIAKNLRMTMAQIAKAILPFATCPLAALVPPTQAPAGGAQLALKN